VDKIFFYGNIIVFWILIILTFRKKGLRLRNIFLWVFYSLYSLTYEVFFGEIFHLYYYISYSQSIAYILIASYFLYPPAALIYAIYMPDKGMRVVYTCVWIVLLLALELASIYTKTIVLTGWRIIPWSIITYIASYTLIFLIDKYLKNLLPDKKIC